MAEDIQKTDSATHNQIVALDEKSLRLIQQDAWTIDVTGSMPIRYLRRRTLTMFQQTRLFVMAVLLALSSNSFAQNTPVSEACEKDEDCQTGNCVSLKEENKKVCLYCRQSDYDGYWLEVQAKCKDLDELGRYADLQSELKKSVNRKNEYSLPYLFNRRENSANCLTARSTRENNCWKDKTDSEHQRKINDLKEALKFTDDLINDSIRNGKAYTVDRAHFDDLLNDEEENCKELPSDFKWFSDIKDDEKLDCSRLSSVIDHAIDCREVRKSIADVFKDGASAERKDALKEAEAAEAEAKRTLDLKKSKSLCQ